MEYFARRVHLAKVPVFDFEDDDGYWIALYGVSRLQAVYRAWVVSTQYHCLKRTAITLQRWHATHVRHRPHFLRVQWAAGLITRLVRGAVSRANAVHTMIQKEVSTTLNQIDRNLA